MNDNAAAAGLTVAVAATTSSVAGTIAFNANILSPLCQVANLGPDVAFVRFGATAATAVATDLAVLPGTFRDLSCPQGTISVAAICPTSTAAVYFTPIDKS